MQINTNPKNTIELNIPNDLLQMFGSKALKEYMQKRLELLKMQLLADKIGEAIEENNLDWENELEKAKKEAWKEYNLLKK